MILPSNKTRNPEPSPALNTSSSMMTSLSNQQGSQWGPSDIGTVVFGCIASILGISTLWMMYWVRQREPSRTMRSDENMALQHNHVDATGSDDGVALRDISCDGNAGPEAVEGYIEVERVNTEA